MNLLIKNANIVDAHEEFCADVLIIDGKIAELGIELNKKDVKEKNKNINLDMIKDIFTIQNIIIYILSFLISTVSIKDGLFPFGFAFFVAACSSTIPAGPVLVTTFLGILISQGSGAFLINFLNQNKQPKTSRLL